MNGKNLDLGHGYFLKTDYIKEKNRIWFIVDIEKDGKNLIYDSKLIGKCDK